MSSFVLKREETEDGHNGENNFARDEICSKSEKSVFLNNWEDNFHMFNRRQAKNDKRSSDGSEKSYHLCTKCGSTNSKTDEKRVSSSVFSIDLSNTPLRDLRVVNSTHLGRGGKDNASHNFFLNGLDYFSFSREIVLTVPEILQSVHVKYLAFNDCISRFTNVDVERKNMLKNEFMRSTSLYESLSKDVCGLDILYSPINKIPHLKIFMEARRKTKEPSGHRPCRNSTPENESEVVEISDLRLSPDENILDVYNIKKIGSYNLVKTLGSGSTSKVKLACHEKTGKQIAVKIITRDRSVYKIDCGREEKGCSGCANKREYVSKSKNHHARRRKPTTQETFLIKEARLLREISLLSVLDHPNIVKIYGYYSNIYFYIIFMEYVEGGPLLHYIIKNGRLKEGLAREFFGQILSILYYVHSKGVVHRDLKIENILIGGCGNLKLIDFGLSNFYHDFNNYNFTNKKYVGPRSMNGIVGANIKLLCDKVNESPGLLKTFCGSLYYAAPELLHGRPYIGPEIDMWSLGVTLYVLACGRVPFDDKKLSVLHEKIKIGKVKYPNHLSPMLVSVLSSMLTVDSCNRATVIELMNHPWLGHSRESSANALHGEPTSGSYFSNIFKSRFSEERTNTCNTNVHTSRIPITMISNEVVVGMVFLFGYQYSYRLLYYLVQKAISNWDKYQFHPIVSVYYLVQEKINRSHLMLKGGKKEEYVIDPEIGLSTLGREYTCNGSRLEDLSDSKAADKSIDKKDCPSISALSKVALDSRKHRECDPIFPPTLDKSKREEGDGEEYVGSGWITSVLSPIVKIMKPFRTLGLTTESGGLPKKPSAILDVELCDNSDVNPPNKEQYSESQQKDRTGKVCIPFPRKIVSISMGDYSPHTYRIYPYKPEGQCDIEELRRVGKYYESHKELFYDLLKSIKHLGLLNKNCKVTKNGIVTLKSSNETFIDSGTSDLVVLSIQMVRLDWSGEFALRFVMPPIDSNSGQPDRPPSLSDGFLSRRLVSKIVKTTRMIFMNRFGIPSPT